MTLQQLKSNPNILLGSYCELNNIEEIKDLEYGMDFRLPQYRKEVFLRFYEFHLKYRIHPGLVYLLMPYLAKKLNMTQEQKYWFAFINGGTQNPCTSYVLFSLFPDFEKINIQKLKQWHDKYWKRLDYDIDRRYIKGHFVEMVEDYKNNLGGMSQVEFFESKLAGTNDVYQNFWNTWNYVINNFSRFGRLSTFSYLEYLKIMGQKIDCASLFLEDLSGSKSHRNGIMIVRGRDDLDWFKENTNFPGHSKEVVDWAKIEADKLLLEAKQRFQGRDFYQDVNYFTLESTLCCYKSWHRENRRYPNVYTDMHYNRIKKAESMGWKDHGLNFDIFWEARRDCLPSYLRLEDNPQDPGLVPEKQNHYRLTGQPVMMDKEWSCFKNDFNDKYYNNDKKIKIFTKKFLFSI